MIKKEKTKAPSYNYPALYRFEKKKGTIIGVAINVQCPGPNVWKITTERSMEAEHPQSKL